MSDLVAFLRARLDEDEKWLRIVTESGKRSAEEATPQDMADGYSLAMTLLRDPAMRELLELAEHATVLPPNHNDRLLREVAAKREIVTRCAVSLENPANIRAGLARRVLADLAAVYAGHPDYDEAWRP